MKEESIILRGVKTHNLQNIDVSFPMGKFTVVTGVSGSGKSSLVFDTLYGESYRRYLESLSSFARQHMPKLPVPPMEEAINLPPSVAIGQQKAQNHPRSSVATLTEIDDLFPSIFSQLGTETCSTCNSLLKRDSTDTILHRFLGQSVLLLAPLTLWQMEGKDLSSLLIKEGFRHVHKYKENKIYALQDLESLLLPEDSVVIQKGLWRLENEKSLVESLNLAFKIGKGYLQIQTPQGTENFSSLHGCASCKKAQEPLNWVNFSFHHPKGACSICQGSGQRWGLSMKLLMKSYPQKTFPELSQFPPFHIFASRHELWEKILMEIQRFNLTHQVLSSFQEKDMESMENFFKDSWASWRESFGPFFGLKMKLYRQLTSCEACQGSRLSEPGRHVKVYGKSLGELWNMEICDVVRWLQESMDYFGEKTAVLWEVFEELKTKLSYLEQIGLGYLTLGRQAGSLSGGENQRLRLARALATALTGTLYCLDEPTAGLHPRDSHRLLQVLFQLRDQGNTLVVVEHDPEIIAAADHTLVIGPGAGFHGGKICENIINFSKKQNLSSKIPKSSFLELKNVRTHNLKNVTCKIPLGHMTGVCGVSGSGKSSLILKTLYPALLAGLEKEDHEEESSAEEAFYESLEPKGWQKWIGEVHAMGQRPIHRSRRSNLATYLDLWQPLRLAFARKALESSSPLQAKDFSFNVEGGRCSACEGLGFIEEDLSFLGNINIPCETCQGQRFQPQVLKIQFCGFNVFEVLCLTAQEAYEKLGPELPSEWSQKMKQLLDLGLGYLTLGQGTHTFSGGEAQRLKLLSLILTQKSQENQPCLFIMDEPSTGLSESDVSQLLIQLKGLCHKGHTVVIVEHNLQILRSVDWLLEIGPEASKDGGHLVYQGPPGGLKGSITSFYL